MAWQLDGTKKTRAQLMAMTVEERRAFYKSGCAYFRDLNNVLSEVRAIRNAENKVIALQKELEAAKAEFASTAKQGGGL